MGPVTMGGRACVGNETSFGACLGGIEGSYDGDAVVSFGDAVAVGGQRSDGWGVCGDERVGWKFDVDLDEDVDDDDLEVDDLYFV
mmetsp:Transcript_33189/g.74238  ORF Transcript_33189/g.74238 Transcript_33189/m.74238 type:complete len:85 (+) Transcript_33189:529-783(+)